MNSSIQKRDAVFQTLRRGEWQGGHTIAIHRGAILGGSRLPRGLKLFLGAMVCFGGILTGMPPQASAHSVYIYAWPDGSKICTESYFNRQSKVVGGEVIMSGADGTELGRAKTGEDGGVCFDLPGTPDSVTFTLLAGQGHKSEYILDGAELAEAVRAAAEERRQTGDASGTAQALSDSSGKSGVSPVANVRAEDIRAIVREEMQNQLGPLHRALAEAKSEREPGVRDIVGGLGWIAGIAALAYWVARKRGGGN